MTDPRTDEQLLAAVATEPEAFGVFYLDHVRLPLGFLMRRTGNAELAADLCAETFAAALDGLRRFDPRRGPAVGWFTGSPATSSPRPPAAASSRTARAAASACARRADRRRPRGDRGRGRRGGDGAARAAGRPARRGAGADRRGARIREIARTSEAVVRKRVPRGLAGLRSRMKENGA